MQIRNGAMSQNNGGNSEENQILRLQQTQTVRKTIQGISQLLNTGLSPDTLDACVKLCEAGVHPQVLADVINQIRREMATLENDN